MQKKAEVQDSNLCITPPAEAQQAEVVVIGLVGEEDSQTRLTEEVRAAESILRAGTARREALQILSGGAGASYREIHEKPAENGAQSI